MRKASTAGNRRDRPDVPLARDLVRTARLLLVNIPADLEAALRAHAASLTTIRGATNALACAADRCPDLILVDSSAGLSSVDVLVAGLRQDKTLAMIPVVVLVDDEWDGIDELLEPGLLDIALRSWNIRALVHRMQSLLEIRLGRIRAAELQYRNDILLKSMPDSIFALDANGTVTAQISPGAAVPGSTNGITIGRSIAASLPEHLSATVTQHLRKISDSSGVHELEYSHQGHHLQLRLMRQDDATVLAFVRDVSSRKRVETKIHELAYHDPLTGLPNRLYFNRILQATVERASASDGRFGILYIDLDRFKRINDTFGHSMGDNLLKTIARRLSGCIRDGGPATGGTLARLSGDEFVMIAGPDASEASLALIAERFQQAFGTPFVHDNHRFLITPSIGIALYPDDGESATELLRNADAAMYRAKSEGQNGFRFYSATQRMRTVEHLDLEHELRSAIRNGELSLAYQPKYDLATGTIVGAEALLRWRHPTRGWIAPGDFIPLAEESALILDIGSWVLEEVCRQLKLWNAAERGLTVSINASSPQFRLGGFAQQVLDALHRHAVAPAVLEVEITESLLMQNHAVVIEQLHQLRDMGVRISIDDFGTGYSSLSYLKDFPIHSLKIDRSFIRDLHTSRNDAAICTAIIAMARELGLVVIAEGVETRDQLDFLRSHGCHQIQGFLIGRPVPAEEFITACAAYAHGCPEMR